MGSLSLCNQVGPCHLCHRRGWSSLRQRHWKGAGGRQCRSRNTQESGKFRQRQSKSLFISLMVWCDVRRAGGQHLNSSKTIFTVTSRYGILSSSLISLSLSLLWPFPTLKRNSHLPCSLLLYLSLSPFPPSFPGGWMDGVFASCGGHGVKHVCWGEWLNNQLSFLTAPNELHRSHGQEAISPLLPRLWTQLSPSLPSFSPSLLASLCFPSIHPIPLHRQRQCLLVHYHKSTNNVTSLPPPLSE